jgi:hypothetical protein
MSAAPDRSYTARSWLPKPACPLASAASADATPKVWNERVLGRSATMHDRWSRAAPCTHKPCFPSR